MMYTAKYGERRNLEEVADAMGVAYSADMDTMELAEILAAKVIDLMKELQIKSIKDSGFTLEDCLLSAESFAHDGAFGNSPGAPGMDEVRNISNIPIRHIKIHLNNRMRQRKLLDVRWKMDTEYLWKAERR